MTIPFWCLFAGCLIPFLLSASSGYFRVQQFGSADNKNPRAQQAALEGKGARLVAAQKNAWEALAIFTAAVAVNSLHGHGEGWLSGVLALVWLGARILHPIFYVYDLDKLRSLIFVVGFACSLALFFV
ncbi:MAG: MAPEG family protein [Myxococcota bacterium]